MTGTIALLVALGATDDELSPCIALLNDEVIPARAADVVQACRDVLALVRMEATPEVER